MSARFSLLTGWTSQRRRVHFVLTAGVLTSNGTLGRAGLISEGFQQRQISGAHILDPLAL